MHVGVMLALACLDFNRDWIEMAVPHATARNHGLRELDDLIHGPFQDHGLDAVVVVQVRMHGRDGYIMVVVLHAHQALCQLALVMVIDVTQHAHAILRRFLLDSLI